MGKFSDATIDLGNGQTVKNPFADVLQSIGEEQERNAVISALEKTPKGQELLKQLAIAADNGEKYVTYYENDRKVLKDAADKAMKELETLKATPQNRNTQPSPKTEETSLEDMNLAQLMEKVEADLRGKGFISRADAEALADAKNAQAMANMKLYLAQSGLPAVESFVQAPLRFQQEFGKAMDVPGFKKFVDDNKYTDVNKAYEAFTQDARIDKIKTDAFTQGKLDGAKEANEENAKRRQAEELRRMPTDITGSVGAIGADGHAAVESDIDKLIGKDYQLGRKGNFKLAHAVAEQIAKDKAAGKVL